MVKQCLVGALLLLISDLCLAEFEANFNNHSERKIISLQSITILPQRISQTMLSGMSLGEQRSETPANNFGAGSNAVATSDDAEESFMWGLIGNGVGFNKRF